MKHIENSLPTFPIALPPFFSKNADLESLWKEGAEGKDLDMDAFWDHVQSVAGEYDNAMAKGEEAGRGWRGWERNLVGGPGREAACRHDVVCICPIAEIFTVAAVFSFSASFLLSLPPQTPSPA